MVTAPIKEEQAMRIISTILLIGLLLSTARAEERLLTCQIVNIKDYDPPIIVNRKHMHEVWLRKYTCVVPGGKYRLYETLDTKDVYDVKKGDTVTWVVDMFGEREVRGCVEDMQID